ncbi:hypothetical protein ASPZODRAFT_17900 [Penicilliopsis zonata CBS 506.65]|uniref:Zn(2)-C6 fungal-type domain-containing protein n=1 Tax=Penicilliopsis zonata CBS 506.65 TaxID=1073090 RepID=A0A1L9SCQ2_9EURO|nr:hypothetical protein ASPZODRAFT_17900 [Penicilliopsis zonata CBS 506.65]OJJ44990.1 hypothetical protein ASPZODRAFT_17900 [Penicilliopsis zonata CBS 506.65]
MQSLLFSQPALSTSQFGHSVLKSIPERLPFNLSGTSNARGPYPRPPPNLRSMSGSPLGEKSLETLGSTTRSGPSDLPALSDVAPPPIIAAASSASVRGEPHPVQDPSATQVRKLPPSRLSENQGYISSQPPRIFGAVEPSSFAAAVPPSLSSATAVPRALPQKQTRRTKAHVASACVNCKKKHLGCDPARPCRRCVVAGKAATCVDVTHKKRGRPPLKAEEPSVRSFATQSESAGATAEAHPASHTRRYSHRSTTSRELRPMTDLQAPGTALGDLGLKSTTGQPPRWSSASAFPPNPVIDPSLSIHGNMAPRSFSVGSPPHLTPPVLQQPTFGSIASGFGSTLGASRPPARLGRTYQPYQSPSIPSTSPLQYQQPFPHAISPFLERSRPGNLPAVSEPFVPREPRDSYLDSSVRLPPIYPPMPTTGPGPYTHAHRLSDPYLPSWSRLPHEERIQERHPPPPPSLGEPVSPHTRIHRSPPGPHQVDISPQADAATRAGEHPVRPPETPLPVSRAEPPTSESESSGPRPRKRRKMALDDMVNG